MYEMKATRLLARCLPNPAYLLLRSLYNQQKRTVSQMGQDFWVFGEAFNGKKNGYFLEIGSSDGVLFNNTFLLEKRYGWKGICIEADPVLFQDLRRVRKARCLNVCVDSREGEVEYARREDGFGGILGENTDNKREEVQAMNASILRLPAKTLHSILQSENAPSVIDYLSIDVEGSEDRILCEFPFDQYTFRCMTVERPKGRLKEVLSQHGYILIKEIPGFDVFYIHESFSSAYQANLFRFWTQHSW